MHVGVQGESTGLAVDRRRSGAAFDNCPIDGTVELRSTGRIVLRAIRDTIDSAVDRNTIRIGLHRNWVRHIEQTLAVQPIRSVCCHKTLLQEREQRIGSRRIR